MSNYSELVQQLRGPIKHPQQLINASHEAADAIELLQRELKCSKEMWEQQQELALEYLADIEKANERIAELEAALLQIREDERERCAKIAERFLSNNEPVRLTASSIAAAIRETRND